MANEKYPIRLQESPSLFADYLYHYPAVAPFFEWDPHHDLLDCIKSRIEKYSFRQSIVGILQRQNKVWSPSAASRKNIQKLGQSNTVGVVTGQQAGIYGGPLYTVYKIMTTVRLSAVLQEKFPQYQFVPVFWMEVGDNDFREVNHFYLLDSANQLVRLALPDQPDDRRSIYKRPIPGEIRQIEERLPQLFFANDYRDEILTSMKEIFSAGRNMAEAFGQWIHHTFGDLGIVVVNPADRDLFQMGQSLYHRALEQWDIIQREFQQVNRELEGRGYHAQIQLNAKQVLFFLEQEDGERARVEMEGGQVLAASPHRTQWYSVDNLRNLIDSNPEKFTTNVALRPILQDTLLPTAIYVAGPAEISYAAQLKPLYHLFGIVPPLFYPRQRVTVVEEKIGKAAEKLNLRYEEIFLMREGLIEQKVRQQADSQLKEIFERTRLQIFQAVEEFGKNIIPLDRSLESSVHKTRDNLMEILDKLRQKSDEAFRRRMETEIAQMNKILVNFFPQEKFQERVFNILQYQVKYGDRFLTHLHTNMDMSNWDHQLIFL